MVARTISHYRILKKLGAGGMAEVYLAEDTRLGRRVALKLLPDQFTDDKDRLLRFEQEARAASALNHPNIITIHEVGFDEGVHFIATEFVEGETLRQHMAAKRMELRDALDVAIQVAGALAAAHQAGIVHRDIKPENIMLRPDGYVKVLDFGIVKLTENFADQQLSDSKTDEKTVILVNTEANVVMGSPNYMSPEQARGLKVDARTDIFSLGVMLYEMIADRRPFDGATASDVIVSILNHEPPPLARYSPDVSEALEWIVTNALRKDREERYQTAKELLSDLRSLKSRLEFKAELQRSGGSPPQPADELASGSTRAVEAAVSTVKERRDTGEQGAASRTSGIIGIVSRLRRGRAMVAAALVIAAVAGLAYFYYTNKAEALSERDTILLADFVNTTGEGVFDGTMRQALAVQLEQSPFLNIFGEEQVRESLRYMGRSGEERITAGVAREICERQGLKAFLTGSISNLRRNYVITLEAINGRDGSTIAREQVEAESKEEVLRALGRGASRMREKLGESLSSIARYDAPIEQATTSSLEALKAFSLGNEQRARAKYLEAIPFYKSAVELDPNFALAYARLSVMYGNTDQLGLSAEYAAKAFELRGRVSEYEKFYISWRYYSGATREVDRAVEVLEVWKRTYPRDYTPRNSLAYYYALVGKFDKAIEEAQEAIRLNATRPQPYSNLGTAFLRLNRFDEARQIYEQALSQNIESTGIHSDLYRVAFVQGDTATMQQQLDWAAGRPNNYDAYDWQAATAAFSGQLKKAREYSGRAIELAEQRGVKDVAAGFASLSILRDAILGDCQKVRKGNAADLIPGQDWLSLQRRAHTLALCGQLDQAQSLTDELARRNPKDTVVNEIWVPVTRAEIEIRRGNPARAVQLLQGVTRFEGAAFFWPAHLRGEAYLRLRDGAKAAAEFQTILDNRGHSPVSLLYPLAHLGVARAAALGGEVEKSRKAYQDFLALWKDADADIPLLQQARQEYEKLK